MAKKQIFTPSHKPMAGDDTVNSAVKSAVSDAVEGDVKTESSMPEFLVFWLAEDRVKPHVYKKKQVWLSFDELKRLKTLKDKYGISFTASLRTGLRLLWRELEGNTKT